MRVKAVIAYNGAHFKGFQKQKSTPHTVTTALEKALASLGVDTAVVGSGRTDAGVHATGQVIHFDLPPYWRDLHKLSRHLNGKLTAIRIKHIAAQPESFHARFSAKRRIYRYLFKTTQPSLFEEAFVAHLPLGDSKKLDEALQYFVGTHDFGTFLKTGSETKDHIRHIYKAFHLQRGNCHAIYFEANGFLRAQVRMMIDFAFGVANDRLTLTQLKEQLTHQAVHNRMLAPPQGLYLARVLY